MFGFGGSFAEFRMGIPDNFVEHGSRDELLVDVGLCSENLISILTDNRLEAVYEW